MATVKKSKTKKIVWAVIACILVVALIVGGVAVKSNNKKTEVTLNTISTESIVQTVSSTGTISSGLKREYKPGTVATVKTVNVKVGDEVKKGTVLATFDTSSLDSQVASLNSAYTSANASYQEAVKHQKEAQTQLDSINKQIKKLEKVVEDSELKAEKATSTTKKNQTATTTVKETTTRKQYQLPNIGGSSSGSGSNTPNPPAVTPCPEGQHNYEFKAGAESLAGHRTVCSVCGDSKIVEHTYTYKSSDANTHTLKCTICGYLTREPHGWTAVASSGTACPKASLGCPATKPIGYSETDAQLEIAMDYATEMVEMFKNMSGDMKTALEEIKTMGNIMKDLAAQLTSVAKDISSISGAFQIMAQAIITSINDGTLSSEGIADAVGKSVTAAIKQGMIEFIDSGAAVQMIETAVKNVDWKAIGKGMVESENFVSTAAQVQLTSLYAQKEIYTVTASMSTVSAQKQALNATKNAYDTVRAARDDLAAGWTADFTGVVTTCDIVAGGQTTALQTAITLENMKERVITISLGEYDVHKVKVGMDATVKTAYGTYDGVVEFIAPTATGGSESSMLDSVGSMAGISGLSSLTSAGAGVECKILVKHPDENIIVGFDADVEIVTGTYNDIPAVPIESIVLEKEGTYVYLYDPEEETVTKTKIETGATSDTSYQVKSGLAVGQQIVATPQTDYEEETFKVKVVEKK